MTHKCIQTHIKNITSKNRWPYLKLSFYVYKIHKIIICDIVFRLISTP